MTAHLPYMDHYGASARRKAAETHPSYWCEQTQTYRLADGSGDETIGQWCTPHWPAHGGRTSQLHPGTGRAGTFGGSPNATLDTPLKKALVGAGVLAILGSGLYIANKRGAIPGIGSMADAGRKGIPWWVVGGLTVLAAGDAVTPGFPFPGSALVMVPLAGAAWVAKASEYGVPAGGTPAGGASANKGDGAEEVFAEMYVSLMNHPQARKSDFTALQELREGYLSGDITLSQIQEASFE